jgi:hypothetical protein
VLAKLVICISAVVALATSAPPRWHAEEERLQWVHLTDATEKKLLVTVELGGELYADVRQGYVGLTLHADQAASALTVTGRALGRSPPTDAASDAGPGVEVARSAADAPDQLDLGLHIECAERGPLSIDERADSCIDSFEITLQRGAERPLDVYVRLVVVLDGERQRQPPGTFDVRLEELAP